MSTKTTTSTANTTAATTASLPFPSSAAINEAFHAANLALDCAREDVRSAWKHGTQPELDAACVAEDKALAVQKSAAAEWEREWHRQNRAACPAAYAPEGYVNL